METALLLGLALIGLVLVVVIILAWRLPDVFGDFIRNIRKFELTFRGIKIERAVEEAQRAIAEKEEEAPDAEALEAELRQVPSGRRVLWVDDNPKYIEREAKVLRNLGLYVDEVTSNAEAIEMLKQWTYHLIISDIHRQPPQSDSAGLDLPEAMHAEHVDGPPVIYYTYEPDRVEHEGYLVTDRPSELFAEVTRLLGASDFESLGPAKA